MLECPHITPKPMLNLDERYHSYLDGSKKMRIDGEDERVIAYGWHCDCLLYTSPSPRDRTRSRMPSSA